MDALVMELSDKSAALEDQVKALTAEIRRIRAAAQHVLDKLHFESTEDMMDMDRALRSLQRELDQASPSQLLFPKRVGKGLPKAGRRH
jgi:hypothetical protein